MKIGDKIKFNINTVSGKTLECTGILNGKVKDHGGDKYIVTGWSVNDPKTINIRVVEPI